MGSEGTRILRVVVDSKEGTLSLTAKGEVVGSFNKAGSASSVGFIWRDSRVHLK